MNTENDIRGKMEKKIRTNNEEFKNRIMELLDADVSFENIFKTVKTEYPEYASNATKFVNNVNDLVLHTYGYEKMKQYFIRMYIDKHNNQFKWKCYKYTPLWKGLNMSCVMNKGQGVIVKCAKEAASYIDENKLYIPKDFSDQIIQDFKDKRIFNFDELKARGKKDISPSIYLEWLLLRNFSEKEIEDYMIAILLPMLKEKLMTKTQVAKKMFGVNSIEVTTTPILHKYMKKAMGLYNNRRESEEWKEQLYYEAVWNDYSKEEIDKNLKEIVQMFTDDREVFHFSRLLKKKYGISTELSSNLRTAFFKRHPEYDYIMEQMEFYMRNQPYDLIKNNKDNIEIGAEEWIIYTLWRNNLLRKTYDFREMPRDMMLELQMYLKSLTMEEMISMTDIVMIVRRLVERFKLTSFKELTEERLQIWIHELLNKEANGNTLKGYRAKISKLYDGLNELPKYKHNKIKNPAENITMRNIHRNHEHEKYIPPEIAVVLDEVIEEVEGQTQLFYKILRETGTRFGDIVFLELSDLVLDEEEPEYAIIYYYESKVKKKRIATNSYERRFAHITCDLYNEIKQYIEETDELRKRLGTDLVFFGLNVFGEARPIDSKHIANQINNLIDKYELTTKDGQKWHYRNRQTRKTSGVDLISDGASLYNVKNMLGHKGLSAKTAELYYAEVEQQVVLEKNTKFFEQKFKVFLGEDVLKQYTEEERRILYVDFLKQQREVELGHCCKHPREGSCSSLGCNSCASCTKLVTGKKFLPKWERLLIDTIEMIKEYERLYEKEGIPKEDYEKFKEYSRECLLRDQYQAVIDAIMGDKK